MSHRIIGYVCVPIHVCPYCRLSSSLPPSLPLFLLLSFFLPSAFTPSHYLSISHPLSLIPCFFYHNTHTHPHPTSSLPPSHPFPFLSPYKAIFFLSRSNHLSSSSIFFSLALLLLLSFTLFHSLDPNSFIPRSVFLLTPLTLSLTSSHFYASH